MKKFLPYIENSIFPILLVALALILCIQNYTPHTFLSGWDTLHPEFDFKLNILRTFFGVFRPEQGLGAVAAHAHMSEIPRIFILYLLHFFFPIAMLRYLYVFLCLIAGPLGMYFFLLRVVIKKRLPSFLGALFYLLNLGTYQTFVVPFEMFTTLYATLPFVFWLFSEYLLAHKKRTLIFFALTIIVTAPSAYASTLWFMFFASLLIFFVPYTIMKRKKTKGLVKRFFILIGIILILNLYWLLPNIYFAATSGTYIASANINKLFSDQAFLKNKEFGNLKDIFLLKSFYFDWGIYNYKTGAFEQITRVFQDYLSNNWISTIGYIIGSFFLIGFLYVFKKARNFTPSVILLALFCLLFLINDNQPFAFIFSFLQNHVSLFKEAFRFPDDKILNIFEFLLAIFFSFSQLFLLSFFKTKKLKKISQVVIGFGVSLLLIIYMLPAFSGNLIQPFMRVSIPDEYFNLFSALKKDPAGRVANFPVESPWGWVYHDWYDNFAPSYQGAGFLYFGIPQSLMERDFDRWNPLNEQYYREISHAVYSNDKNDFKNVIKKYDISYLLIDTSVISPGSDSKSLYYKEIFALANSLQNDGFLGEKTTFGSFLTLYYVTKPQPQISTLSKVTKVASYNNAYYKDFLYQKFGNYISEANNASQAFFPLTNFMDNEYKVLSKKITTGDSLISLHLPKKIYNIQNADFAPIIVPASVVTTLNKTNSESQLSLSLYPTTPLFDNNSLLAPIKGNFLYPLNIHPLLSINRQVFELNLLQNNSPTALGTVFLNSSFNKIALFDPSYNIHNYSITSIPFSFGYCNGKNNSGLSIFTRPDAIFLNSTAENSVCISIPLSFIQTPNNTSTTLITMNFSSIDYSNLTACLTNPINGECNEYLPLENKSNLTRIRFAINKNDLSSTKLILTVKKGAPQQVLSNLTVTSTQSIAESLLDSSFFKNTLPASFSNVTIPKVIDKNYYAEAKDSLNLQNDCGNLHNIAQKTFVKSEDMVRYTSTLGSYCDHLSFPNLPHSISYLVYIKSKNEKGLAMNLCITNYTSRKCDIYTKLTKFKKPQTDVFLLPQSDLNGTGYDINLENLGILGTPGINDFYSVTFVPIPFSFLSQIQSGNAQVENFSGTIKSQTLYNPMLLTTTVKNSPTLLSLSYAYNPDFHAYEVSCKKGFFCSLSLLFRPLFGRELEHVEISSWKNGWIVPDDTRVLIIFIPQYLEYIGFFAFAVFMTIILFYPLLNHIFRNNLDTYFEKKANSLKDKIRKNLT